MTLRGRIALVTGASRGVGKGVALELAASGATVIVTARTAAPKEGSAGSLQETAASIQAAGGLCEAIAVDHADDAQIERLFATIDERYGQLDVLVNNVYRNPALEMPGGDQLLRRKFWQIPIGVWDAMHGVGLRSHYVASVQAAPLMARARRGLIVNISSWGGRKDIFTVAYGVTKAGVDRLAQGMAAELREFGVAAVSLYPGIVRTELMIEAARERGLPQAEFTETPTLTGRAVVALAQDSAVLAKSGQTLVVAQLAREYGFNDLDGRQPPPLGTL